jgi:hypothetical protein
MTAVSIIGNIAAREHVIHPLWHRLPKPQAHELSDSVTNPKNGCSLLSLYGGKDAKWTRLHLDYSTPSLTAYAPSPAQSKTCDYYSLQIPNKHGIETPFASVISIPLRIAFILQSSPLAKKSTTFGPDSRRSSYRSKWFFPDITNSSFGCLASSMAVLL